MAQRGQRICRLTRLRNEQRQTAFFQHRIAIAEFGRDIDVDGHAGECFKPIFGDHTRVIGCAAGNDGNALHARKIEIHLRQGDGLFNGADIAGERLGDHCGLLKYLFLHVMAVIALFDLRCGHAAGGDFARDRIIILIENLRTIARDDNPVALFQIGDFLCQRRERQRIRTQIGFAVAIARNQWAAEARANQKIGKCAKRNRKCKGTAQAGQHGLHGIGRCMASLHLFRHQMRNNLCIGFAFKCPPAGDKFIAQLLEIFDNAIVHERDFARRMGMRIARGRRAMGGPARMRDANITRRIVRFQNIDKVRKLALCPATDELTIMHGAHTGGVITPILHPLQPIDQPVRNSRFANNSDNSAHLFCFPICFVGDPYSRHLGRKILCISRNEYAPCHLRRSKDDRVRRFQ